MEFHRLQSLLACLPSWFRNYAAVNLDSIPKLVNHLLIFMGGCNCILFLSCWHIPVISDIGFNTPLCVLFLGVQNAFLYIIFNNSRFEGLQFLAPTEFMVGNSLGITIGAALLALVLSNLNRNVARCTNVHSPVHKFVCDEIANDPGSLSSVSFWSGLVFWLEFCLSLLITIGRSELAQANSYENLSMDDRFSEYSPQGQAQQQNQNQSGNSIIGSFANALPTPSFVGNYSTVPEINSTVGGNTGGGGAPSGIPATNTPLNAA